jgi:hypothetical protein
MGSFNTSPPVGSCLSGPRHPDGWLHQHNQGAVAPVAGDTSRRLPACATRSSRSRSPCQRARPPCATRCARRSYPVVAGTPAAEHTGVCARATAPLLGRPCRLHRRDSQRRVPMALLPGQAGGLVCGPHSPTDTHHQPSMSSGVSCPRAATVCDARLSSSRGTSAGVAHEAGTPLRLVPSQPRAQHAGQCSVAVEGGRVPTCNWCLKVHIPTLGSFRYVMASSAIYGGGR